MGILDWIILALLMVFIYLGWRRGLVAAIVQFCGYILSFFLVGHYYPLVQRNLILHYHLARWLATVISVLLILVLIVVVVRIVVYILNRVLKAMKLSTLNKAGGATLGLINGLLIVIIFMVMLDFVPKVSTPLENSQNHRVYAGINILKEELFSKLKLTQRVKLLKLLPTDKQDSKK